MPDGSSQLPLAALVFNFESESLTPADARTLFHELGHAMHTILSKTQFQHQAGEHQMFAPADMRYEKIWHCWRCIASLDCFQSYLGTDLLLHLENLKLCVDHQSSFGSPIVTRVYLQTIHWWPLLLNLLHRNALRTLICFAYDVSLWKVLCESLCLSLVDHGESILPWFDAMYGHCFFDFCFWICLRGNGLEIKILSEFMLGIVFRLLEEIWTQ